MEAIGVLFSHISLWDILIFLFLGFNVFFFGFYIKSLVSLGNCLEQTTGVGYTVNVESGKQPDPVEVAKKLKNVFMWASIFNNTTSIFPMLGILGTVMSLLPLVGTENMDTNFTVALTTTAWGIVFAIVFKAIGSPLSAKMDILTENAQTYLDYKMGYMNTNKSSFFND